MTRARSDMLQGTLELLILRVLASEPLHGWGVSQRIEQISKDVLQVNQGSLYPALHRLEHRGWITVRPGTAAGTSPGTPYYGPKSPIVASFQCIPPSGDVNSARRVSRRSVR